MMRLGARAFSPYRAFFALPDVTAMVFIAWLSRMPSGMIGLSMLMFMRESLGDFKAAGSVVGIYFVSMAVFAPVCGRIIDRIGPNWPLRITGILNFVFLAILYMVVAQKLAQTIIMLTAALAGALAPPIAVLTRTLWRHRFTDDANRRMAFSVDSIMIELNFTVGPALIALVIGGYGTKVAFALSLLVTLGAFLVFLYTPAFAYWKQEAHIERHLMGPLTEPRLLGLFMVTFGLTFSFGILEVGYPAFATYLGIPVLAGILLGINSLGSAVGGAIYGVLHLKTSLERQFAIAIGTMAIPFVLHWWLDQVFIFSVIAFFAGTLIAPALTAQTLLITRIAPNKYATEAFTWSATFIVSGVGIGMAAGGAITEWINVKSPFLLGSIVLAGISIAAFFLVPKSAGNSAT
jgi:MFS family permease